MITANISFYFQKYMYCGSAIDLAMDVNGKAGTGETGKQNYLEVSETPHFLWLTPKINGDGSFTDEYIINTHAFGGRGAAAYPNGGNNKEAKLYHKDLDGPNNTQESWKFEKQCDENSYEACPLWKIKASNGQSPGFYIQAKDQNLYLKEFDEKNDDIREFLWTIEFH